MQNSESPEDRIGRWNREVAALQREGKIQEGVELADKAFFAAIDDLPSGHALAAQSARNRGIMQQMSGNLEEAYKTFIVALDWYGKAHEACIARQREFERSGDVRGAKEAAEQRLELSRAIDQLQGVLSPEQ